jgi:hypothetical protein
VCVVALAFGTATADERSNRPIVLESYVGRGPGAAPDDDLVDLRDQFEGLGYAAYPPSILSMIVGRAPQPGIMDRGASGRELTAAELVSAIEEGYQAWQDARWRDARDKLILAIARFKRNQGLLVTDTNNLNVMYKALAALAFAEQQLGDASACRATLDELIRTFPSQPLPQHEYGRESWNLYREVLVRDQAKGLGGLTINAGNERALIFVDSQLRGTGRVDLRNLYPGAHRVFMQVVGVPGWQYEVEVTAHQATLLSIDWELDSALQVTSAWVGFRSLTDEGRTGEALFAAELVRRWECPGIVVIGPLRQGSKAGLLGTRYNAKGIRVRQIKLLLDERRPRSEQLRAFARALVLDSPLDVAASTLAATDGPTDAVSSEQAPADRSAVMPAIVSAGGVAAFASGVAVFERSRQSRGAAPYTDSTSVGLEIAIGGSIAIGTGAYLWSRQRTGELASACVGSSIALLSSGALLYLVDQDPSPTLPPRIFGTKPTGIALGVGGFGLAGVGLWLWQREHVRSIAPVVHVQDGGGTLEWTGSF